MIGLDIFCGAGGQLTTKEAVAVVKAGGRIVTGMSIGMILATIALALGWKAHRVIGGLLGFFVVGPAVGGTAGWLLSRGEVAAAMQWQAGDRVRAPGIHDGVGTIRSVDLTPAKTDARGMTTMGPYAVVDWPNGEQSATALRALVRA